jgi:hypothetical protein
VTAATREKLRATIKTQLAIKTLHDLCEKGGQHDGVRATAALGLLRKVLPDLVATDITSGDKPLTVQMIDYTKLGDADK